MISLLPFDGPVRRQEGLPRPKIAAAARPGMGPGVRGVSSPLGRELTELFTATSGVDVGASNLGDFMPSPDDLVRRPKSRKRPEIAAAARQEMGQGVCGGGSAAGRKLSDSIYRALRPNLEVCISLVIAPSCRDATH